MAQLLPPVIGGVVSDHARILIDAAVEAAGPLPDRAPLPAGWVVGADGKASDPGAPACYLGAPDAWQAPAFAPQPRDTRWPIRWFVRIEGAPGFAASLEPDFVAGVRSGGAPEPTGRRPLDVRLVPMVSAAVEAVLARVVVARSDDRAWTEVVLGTTCDRDAVRLRLMALFREETE